MEKQLQVISVLQWVLSFLVLGKLGLRGRAGGQAVSTSPKEVRAGALLCRGEGIRVTLTHAAPQHLSTSIFWVPDQVLYPSACMKISEIQWEVV